MKGNRNLPFFSNRLFIDQINHQGTTFKEIGSPNVKMKNLPIIDKRRSLPKLSLNGLSQADQNNGMNERKIQKLFRGNKASRNQTI